MDSIDDCKIAISERRRAIFTRAVERSRARGTPIDGDPLFVALIAAWIDGAIEMSEVARRSSPRGRTIEDQSAAVTAGSTANNTMSNDQLLSELDRIIGINDLSATSHTI